MRRKPLLILPVIAVIAAAFLFIPQERVFVKGYYDALPQTDGKPDLGKLSDILSERNSNTYNFLVFSPDREIPVLEKFLPEAERIGIDVWVTILPPSGLSEANRNNLSFTDYIGIARRIARLSLDHPSLKSWSIDNVILDYSYFTPGYLKSITETAKGINPDLTFIPVVYYPDVMSEHFPERSQYLDGIQLYYTHFPEPGVSESEILPKMLADIRARFDGKIVLGIYATPASPQVPTTPEYIEELLNLAKQHTDGVMIYTMNQEGEHLSVIEKAFE
jgi:hypothetical protein